MNRQLARCSLLPLTLAVPMVGFGPQAKEGRPVTIALPTSWVAFSADSRDRSENGFVHGKFYRASDGSTAAVIESADDPVITINNRQKLRMYSKLPTIGWIEQELSEGALAEPRQTLSLAGAVVQKLDTTVAGGDVYEMASGPRHMRFAVALNGLRIYLADAQGVLSEYTNIVLGEPSSNLFVPEAGAVIHKKHE